MGTGDARGPSGVRRARRGREESKALSRVLCELARDLVAEVRRAAAWPLSPGRVLGVPRRASDGGLMALLEALLWGVFAELSVPGSARGGGPRGSSVGWSFRASLPCPGGAWWCTVRRPVVGGRWVLHIGARRRKVPAEYGRSPPRLHGAGMSIGASSGTMAAACRHTPAPPTPRLSARSQRPGPIHLFKPKPTG